MTAKQPLDGATMFQVENSINYYVEHPIINPKNNLHLSLSAKENSFYLSYLLRIDDAFLKNLKIPQGYLTNGFVDGEVFYDASPKFLKCVEDAVRTEIALHLSDIIAKEIKITTIIDEFFDTDENIDHNVIISEIEFSFNNVANVPYNDVAEALRPLAEILIRFDSGEAYDPNSHTMQKGYWKWRALQSSIDNLARSDNHNSLDEWFSLRLTK